MESSIVGPCWEASKVIIHICSPGTLNTVCSLKELISSQKWVVKKENIEILHLHLIIQLSRAESKRETTDANTLVLRIFLSPAQLWKRITSISDYFSLTPVLFSLKYKTCEVFSLKVYISKKWKKGKKSKTEELGSLNGNTLMLFHIILVFFFMDTTKKNQMQKTKQKNPAQKRDH